MSRLQTTRIVARLPVAPGRTLTVRRDPYHVTLGDQWDPLGHAGYTFHLNAARELGEALRAFRGARIAVDGRVLVAQWTDRGKIQLGAWEIWPEAARQLGEALVVAADHDAAAVHTD
jgi:hypothetical protein